MQPRLRFTMRMRRIISISDMEIRLQTATGKLFCIFNKLLRIFHVSRISSMGLVVVNIFNKNLWLRNLFRDENFYERRI